MKQGIEQRNNSSTLAYPSRICERATLPIKISTSISFWWSKGSRSSLHASEDFIDKAMLSAQQLEEVNIETSRSRDLEKLINQDINVLSLSLLERQRSRVIGRGDEASLLDTGKVCLCPTNCHLYHKDPCPKREINHSEVVIMNPDKR